MKSFYGRRCAKGASKSFVSQIKNDLIYFDAESAKNKIIKFKSKYKKISLEIGFGMGHYLVSHARDKPNEGIIGCDPFINGNMYIVKSSKNYFLKNLLITNLDFETLLTFLNNIKFLDVFIFFPDPWKKRRHNKRRLINYRMTNLLSQILEKGGKVNIITDDKDYWDQIISVFSSNKKFSFLSKLNYKSKNNLNFFKTKYSQKALEGKKKTYFNSFQLTQ